MRERYDLDWEAVVRRVVWVPAAHRQATVTRDAAQRMLRCTPESFDRLLKCGLPAEHGPDGLVFDVFDLRNAALYSGSGLTDMEQAMAAVFTYMRGPTAELVTPRTWLCTLTERMPSAGGGARYARPTPEDFGGSLLSLRTRDGYDVQVAEDKLLFPNGAVVDAHLVTSGIPHTVYSSEIRSTVHDFLDSGIVWHSLPPSLDMAPTEAFALGVGGCVTLSVTLERLLRDAGLEAQAQWGWLTGAVNTPHTFVRVLDDDGVRKCVDPALALLANAGRLGSPEFAEFVIGSCVNRVIPTRLPVVSYPDQTLVERELDLACRAGGPQGSIEVRVCEAAR